MTACNPPSELVSALPGQVDRIVADELFKGSEALRRILLYLGEHAVQAPGRAVKEYEIATEVLGRSIDFDARADSCVRVQVGRLRSRLRRYYAGPGANDPMVLSIPLGCYMLVATAVEPPVPVVRPRPILVAPPQRRMPWTSYGVVAAICLLIGVLLGAAVTRLVITPASSHSWVMKDASRR